MECASCGVQNSPDARFCMSCGATLARPCGSCGALPLPGARFCSQCGSELGGLPAAPVATAPEEAGERRQLTVLFCDLVGSTALGQRLDPEELQEVITTYRETCREAIESFDGHIAQYLGDGLLVYFGYPVAYEDASERAVRAGLAIQDALAEVSARPERAASPLRARIGIHTGEVVIGGRADAGGLALGGTPNIAARLQGVAEPGSVVISDATLRLVSGIFIIEDLGAPELKGVQQPVHVYRVERSSGVPERLGAINPSGPLVGRKRELDTLAACWERAGAGHGQVVLLSADAGVGKSRLVRAFQEQIAASPHTLLWAMCASYASGSGFEPLLRLIREIDFDAAEDPTALLADAFAFPGLDPQATVPYIAHLLGLPPSEAYPLLSMSPELQRMRTLEALASVPVALAELQPLLFVFEDLHWADPSTLAYLELLIDRLPSMRALLVLTHRPEFQPPAGFRRSHATSLDLGPLTPEEVGALVRNVADRELPEELAKEIAARAEGVPLYAEELTRAFADAASQVQDPQRPEPGVRDVAIPPTLQDSLAARLDRLGSPKTVAQLAATLGREFDYDVLQHVSGLEPAALRTSVGHLVEAGVLQQRGELPDAHLSFSHTLIHDAAYGSQLIATRRALHGHILEQMEARFPERATASPHWMVQHAVAADLGERVIHYAERAADLARERLAHEEAAASYQTALDHLEALPEGIERDSREVTLELARGGVLSIAHGYSAPEVFECYTRARAANDRLPEGPAQLPGWIGLAAHATLTSTFPELLEAGQQVLHISEPLPVPTLHAVGHLLCGIGGTTSEEPDEAREHLREAARIAAENPAPPPTPQDPDIEVSARSTLVVSTMVLGDIDEAVEQERLALERARTLDHAPTLALALTMASAAAAMAFDAEKTLELADEGRDLSRERGFAAWRWQNALRSIWARLELGDGAAADELDEVWKELVAAGAHSTDEPQRLFYVLALSAAGRFEDALRECDEAEEGVRRTGEGGLLANVYLNRGITLARSGRIETALEQLALASEGLQGVQRALASFERARLLAERAERDAARTALDAGLGPLQGGDTIPFVRAARSLHAEVGGGTA